MVSSEIEAARKEAGDVIDEKQSQKNARAAIRRRVDTGSQYLDAHHVYGKSWWAMALFYQAERKRFSVAEGMFAIISDYPGMTYFTLDQPSQAQARRLGFIPYETGYYQEISQAVEADLLWQYWVEAAKKRLQRELPSKEKSDFVTYLRTIRRAPHLGH